jgi:hypothetical protein
MMHEQSPRSCSEDFSDEMKSKGEVNLVLLIFKRITHFFLCSICANH